MRARGVVIVLEADTPSRRSISSGERNRKNTAAEESSVDVVGRWWSFLEWWYWHNDYCSYVREAFLAKARGESEENQPEGDPSRGLFHCSRPLPRHQATRPSHHLQHLDSRPGSAFFFLCHLAISNRVLNSTKLCSMLIINVNVDIRLNFNYKYFDLYIRY